MSDPQLAAMKADLEAFDDEINFILCGVVYRSAFRLGLPGQCNNTHFLNLTLSWDPIPQERRDRFHLHSAKVRPFADAQISLPEEFVRMRTADMERLEGFSTITLRLVAYKQADLASPGTPIDPAPWPDSTNVLNAEALKRASGNKGHISEFAAVVGRSTKTAEHRSSLSRSPRRWSS